MTQKNLNVLTGNRVVIRLDNTVVGLLQTVRFSEEYGHEPVYGIGDIDPQEQAPTSAKYSVTVSKVALMTDRLRDAGITALDSDAVLKGVVFDIAVLSKDTNQVLRQATGCSYTGGDFSVEKNAIIISNANFSALKMTGTGL